VEVLKRGFRAVGQQPRDQPRRFLRRIVVEFHGPQSEERVWVACNPETAAESP
jgi:hypothetical protein